MGRFRIENAGLREEASSTSRAPRLDSPVLRRRQASPGGEAAASALGLTRQR
ncbi:MAG: hypothetical protein JNK96_11070 [Betaproteobacteria bacterium]|nr:hypothetical protein [Betaproteobacteria bacterium]HMV21454.1 hypothetical protein [Rhodocyclaceae bacterium]HNL21470.1 hypothetical protein [Rhodocyclaceae bacterium]HNP05269.1 hypothetical protein [Rhodocyclaceae bacterium]